MKKVYAVLTVLLIVFAIVAYLNIVPPYSEGDNGEIEQISLDYFDYTKIPEFDGKKPYVVVNDNTCRTLFHSDFYLFLEGGITTGNQGDTGISRFVFE